MNVIEGYKFQPAFEKALDEPFFMRPTEVVARELVGAALVRTAGGETLAGRIVETEAYLSKDDAASHSFRGKTPRNAAMFGTAGRLYVYKIYGIHHCFNIVAEAEGRGCAVLVRALEPLAGFEAMRERRGANSDRRLCRGPGNAAKAFGFTLADNNSSLIAPDLFVQPLELGESETVAVSRRVGITKACDLPLRFYLSGNPFVSRG